MATSFGVEIISFLIVVYLMFDFNSFGPHSRPFKTGKFKLVLSAKLG